MIGYVALAEGSPCPTLVLDRDALPENQESLTEILREVRRWMRKVGAESVLKIALVSPSRHPLFDLDYRFVQCLPGEVDRFDFRGSCGHSILAAIMVASKHGWLPRLSPSARARVRVLNNGDHVVCEVDKVDRMSSLFTVHFMSSPSPRLSDLLLTAAPKTRLAVGKKEHDVSLVSMGNPYVFIDARALGIHTQAALFADDSDFYRGLSAVREASAELLGFPRDGAFPKVAAVASYRPGAISVRALSVPTWHPTLALTGATCLGAAARIAGTVPHELVGELGEADLELETRGGITAVSASLVLAGADTRLGWVSVSRKLVHFHGAVSIEPLQAYVLKETDRCFPAAI
jgi:2-methylaconitate cis-trans-isomerase PrpF